ncbi:protein spire 1-like isoform X1 [Willisornis vidua]|uniref:Protein spire 1-like isoform X1 n=1 Tax=Willisornis vidua TaxID=1566151 RepID=A0ABQ9DQN4_9PASS|nr:protein spire 1-like isoform X1 [Willisornis vidua]
MPLSFSPNPLFTLSDTGNIQQSQDKLLEYLGMVIYEALDWGIDSQMERELSGPLEKLLYLMLKLDDEPVKPAVTLQDVIKACEEHLPRPSEATRHYEMTCRTLFEEYMELQKLVAIIKTSKEQLKKMDVEDLAENRIQKKEKHGPAIDLTLTGFPEAPLWPGVICELQAGVRLRKASERPQPRVPPRDRIRSPYELLLDDIQHKRYTLRKVIIEPKHRAPKVDVAAPKPHLKSVGDVVLHLMIAKQEKLVTPNTALTSPSDSFLTLQDSSTAFKIVNTKTQQLGPEDQLMNILSSGLQESTPKLPDSTCLSSTRSSVVSYSSTGLTADSLCPPRSASTLGDVKPKGFLNTGQQQLPPYRRRSKSLGRGLHSKELDYLFPTKWPSPTIAELIRTRYSMMVLEGQCFFQRDSDGVFLRAQMSMPFRTCVHLPLHFLKFLRLSRVEDPAIQEQKSSELLHEIEHRQYFGDDIFFNPGEQPLLLTMASHEDLQGQIY